MGNAPAVRNRPGVDVGGKRADVVFEVLAHPYRRFALWYLREANGQSTVPQLARELETWQSKTAATQRGVSGVATISLSLRHTHVPKLEDASMVEHDPGQQAVRLLESAGDALEHIEQLM